MCVQKEKQKVETVKTKGFIKDFGWKAWGLGFMVELI